MPCSIGVRHFPTAPNPTSPTVRPPSSPRLSRMSDIERPSVPRARLTVEIRTAAEASPASAAASARQPRACWLRACCTRRCRGHARRRGRWYRRPHRAFESSCSRGACWIDRPPSRARGREEERRRREFLAQTSACRFRRRRRREPVVFERRRSPRGTRAWRDIGGQPSQSESLPTKIGNAERTKQLRGARALFVSRYSFFVTNGRALKTCSSSREASGQEAARAPPLLPSDSSMRSASFHLAVRSERAHEPTFNCPAPQPTARWTIVTSSVSPERADTIVDQPAARAA